jgi:hypothetical protein
MLLYIFHKCRIISETCIAQSCEADHSPPSDAEVKNDGAIPSLPHMF